MEAFAHTTLENALSPSYGMRMAYATDKLQAQDTITAAFIRRDYDHSLVINS